ncbi:MAG: palindromic element RPE2 domain-containing protein [Candidatus Tisiphia sp.]|nr:palindromic element RPE2 domain-containing protein [Candidatus Tisiphia sp.]
MPSSFNFSSSIKSIISDICIFLSHYLYELNLYTIFSYILTPFLTFNSCGSDGATPISNRRATSDDVPNFSSIDYSTTNTKVTW